jgi:subtilase family serine protease
MYANNGAWSSFRTTSKSSNKPDLRITDISFVPASLATGASKLTVTYKNFGSATAFYAPVAVFVDQAPNGSNYSAGGAQNQPIAPNEQAAITFYDLPELATGSHQIYAVVDFHNEIDELNENKN